MKYVIKDYPELKAQVENMSIDDMLRTIICPYVWPGIPTPRKTGAVFIHPRETAEAVAKAKEINDGRENPALIVSDMECGPGGAIVGAVKFPSMRAVAEAGNVQNAYEMGVIAAKQARQAGYHWTFGPCVDLVINKNNPVTCIRTAGIDPDTDIAFSGAYIDGLQENGLIATAKHFPGDGVAPDDQHVTTSVNSLSKEEWEATYGKVYKNLIDRGVMAIMPGHIALPAFDEMDKNGLYPPASLSKNLLTGLLREKLGFEGLIVSDAVNMNGFCGYMNLYKACCTYLEAGGDCMLFMHDTPEYISEMKACMEEGYLSLETLKLKAYRMLCFAKEYFEKFPTDEKIEIDLDAAEAVAKEVAVNAVKIVRDRNNTLPLKLNKDSKILHVVLHNEWFPDISEAEKTAEKLSKFAEVETIVNPKDELIANHAKSGKYDYIICSVLERSSYATQTSRLCGLATRSLMCGWMHFKTPVVFIGYQDFNFGNTYIASVDTLINSYGFTQYTGDAIIDKLLK